MIYQSVLALLFASVLLAYFYVIDPTVQNRQGNDRGSQYQTGVYFTNESERETVKRIAEIERGRSEKFFVEIGPLKNFYPAEEYHQNYLEKNPNGYCHTPRAEMELFSRLRIDPGDYQKPRRRLPSRSCVHRRSGVAQRRALLHQQRGPALRPLCCEWNFPTLSMPA